MNPTRLKNFYVLDKEDVNGPQASDLWRFLGESLQNPIAKTKSEFVSLNYEKFLLDGQGRPLRRYPRKWKPIKMLKEVKNLAKGEKLPPVDPDFKLAWLNANKERMADLYSFRLGINWYVPKGLEAMEGTRDAES
uniref:Uncharacterized protein n=1 Tax=Chromera velia CCMP2878 TaxID=1169474 RepID=A0A0G4I948_9ALVE|eukprot:Cvel_12159.t1-p1 / transcript=Cvel_12159.t1 / gene=Cvel_12159 / organism=Chromera_velia_CCMP2878 / gene_product=Putative glutathione peroxidase 7, chloroplastic, putative / transcript_product=Putative glutathione peroxidase 7, chloroplastic, putative / location=Cvel_scaffold784:37315-38775(-) / protein_length=134 / sequence_SO=supercontig / SO=protein_coding / is_pseudo=false